MTAGPDRRRDPLQGAVPPALGAVGAVGALLFVLPMAALLVRAPWGRIWAEVSSPEVSTALGLSVVVSVSATVLSLMLGLPLAWVQARGRFRGRALLRGITALPIVLPPVVGGVALLLAFGRRGLIGAWLYEHLGVTLPFSTAGAVLAATFVSMPFLILTLDGAFRSLDGRHEAAAQTLGASPWTVFWRVTLPMVRPSLIAGTVLTWARALGEFGATITFAGNFPGRTQTVPLAVLMALERRPDAAIVLSLVLLAISLTLLVGLRSRLVEAL